MTQQALWNGYNRVKQRTIHYSPEPPLTPGCLSQMWYGGRKRSKKGWGLVIALLGPVLKRYINWRCSLFCCGLLHPEMWPQGELLTWFIHQSRLLLAKMSTRDRRVISRTVKRCRGAWQGTWSWMLWMPWVTTMHVTAGDMDKCTGLPTWHVCRHIRHGQVSRQQSGCPVTC